MSRSRDVACLRIKGKRFWRAAIQVARELAKQGFKCDAALWIGRVVVELAASGLRDEVAELCLHLGAEPEGAMIYSRGERINWTARTRLMLLDIV